MWISSFVVTLEPSENRPHPVEQALEAMPVFTVGELAGARLPVVLEAPDGATARYWHEWVEQLPGVIQVEVAFISFEESDRDHVPDLPDSSAGPGFGRAKLLLSHEVPKPCPPEDFRETWWLASAAQQELRPPAPESGSPPVPETATAAPTAGFETDWAMGALPHA